MAAQIKLYDNGMKAMLRSNPRELIDQIGRQVATNTDVGEADDVEVTTRSYTTDRAAIAVAIDGAAGMAIEAKHSPLMRAAAAAGLQVRRA